MSKEVVGPAGEGQEFTFEITLTDKDGKSLEGSYPAQKTGNTDGNSAIENVSDGSQVTLQGDDTLGRRAASGYEIRSEGSKREFR